MALDDYRPAEGAYHKKYYREDVTRPILKQTLIAFARRGK